MYLPKSSGRTVYVSCVSSMRQWHELGSVLFSHHPHTLPDADACWTVTSLDPSVLPTCAVPEVVSVPLITGSASAGDARPSAPITPSSPALRMVLRRDKSPPPCGPARVPTSWLESAGGQLDHSSTWPAQDDIRPSNVAATYSTVKVAAKTTKRANSRRAVITPAPQPG